MAYSPKKAIDTNWAIMHHTIEAHGHVMTLKEILTFMSKTLVLNWSIHRKARYCLRVNEKTRKISQSLNDLHDQVEFRQKLQNL